MNIYVREYTERFDNRLKIRGSGLWFRINFTVVGSDSGNFLGKIKHTNLFRSETVLKLP